MEALDLIKILRPHLPLKAESFFISEVTLLSPGKWLVQFYDPRVTVVRGKTGIKEVAIFKAVAAWRLGDVSTPSVLSLYRRTVTPVPLRAKEWLQEQVNMLELEHGLNAAMKNRLLLVEENKTFDIVSFVAIEMNERGAELLIKCNEYRIQKFLPSLLGAINQLGIDAIHTLDFSQKYWEQQRALSG